MKSITRHRHAWQRNTRIRRISWRSLEGLSANLRRVRRSLTFDLPRGDRGLAIDFRLSLRSDLVDMEGLREVMFYVDMVYMEDIEKQSVTRALVRVGMMVCRIYKIF